MSLPFVSVIMPVYNEAPFIRRALEAVLTQDYPPACVEVLVVDGRSTDGTRQIVGEIIQADDRVRLMDNPGRIQARALNLGLEAARGDVIVRVDGHTLVAPDYITRCVVHLRATGADQVGGPLRFVGLTPTGRAIAAAHRSPFCVPSRYRVSRQPAYTDIVYLGAWPRAVFERVGRFNEALAINEDYEFSYRIRRAGGRVFLTPDIRSDYYGRQTLGALWRQFYHYGRWKLRMLARYPASIRPRQVVAPAFVAALLGGALFAPWSRGMRRLWLATVMGYGAANLLASARQAAQEGWALLPRLPFVFACVHVSWGSGFLRELVALLAGRSTGYDEQD